MESQAPKPKYLLVKLHVNAVRIISALVSDTWVRKKKQTFYPGHFGSDSTIIKATRNHSAPDKSKWHSYSYELCATYDDFDVAEKKLLKGRKGESIESTDVDQKGKHCRKKKPSIYAALSASQQLERKNCSEEEDDSESDDVLDCDELESSSSSSSDEDDAPLIKAPKPPAVVVQAGQSQEIIDRDDDTEIESGDHERPLSPSVSVSKEPVRSEPTLGTSNEKNADLLPVTVQVLQKSKSTTKSLVSSDSSEDEPSEKSKEQSTEPLEKNATKKGKFSVEKEGSSPGVNPLNGGSASRKRPHAPEAQSRKGTANDRTLNNKDSSAAESEAEEVVKKIKKTKKKKSFVADKNGKPPGKKTEESGNLLKWKVATVNTSSCHSQSASKRNTVESSYSEEEEYPISGKEVALRHKSSAPEKASTSSTSSPSASGSASQSASNLALAKIVRQNRSIARKQKILNDQMSGALAAPTAPRSLKIELGLDGGF